MYQNGETKRAIAREVGASRNTVKKYIDEYEDSISKLSAAEDAKDDISLNMLVEKLSSPPKYNSSNRRKHKLTDDIICVIDKCLEDNERKINERKRKQVMKAIDIFELLQEKNFDIGYTTVCNYIREQTLKREAYVRQNYAKGHTLEFDWGEVKLKINGEEKKIQLALFSTAYGSYHCGRLYNNQRMESFLDMHVNAFKHFDGVYKEVVYDNMKTAVKKFVGPTEKEATEDLMKISMYYGFDYRFCNARKGNEKGHVERGVEYVRRKAFSRKDEFDSLEEANEYLMSILCKLNAKEKRWLENKSALDMLMEEKECLLSLKPDYVIAKKAECRVDKYGTITIHQNRYSVPEYLVGKFVIAKIYPEVIKILYKDQVVGSHKRSFKVHQWVLDINHYLGTLKKKPGSLKNSAALHCSDHRIKKIYKEYYIKNPKEFIELLEIIKEKGINKVEDAIEELINIKKSLVTTENIRNIVNQTPHTAKPSLTKESDNLIEKHSIELLNAISTAFKLAEKGRFTK